ncbi:competence/damage-inducible protein CinA [Ostertagia ostertagi]
MRDMDLFTKIEERTVATCGQKLIEKGMTIAFAESATGGRMAAEFSLVKDSGKFLKGGFVCYDACLKESVLHVPAKLIEEFTPESTEVTFAITSGLMGLIEAGPAHRGDRTYLSRRQRDRR